MKVNGDRATGYPPALKTSLNPFQKSKEAITAWTGPVWEAVGSHLPSHAAISDDQVWCRQINQWEGDMGYWSNWLQK